VTRPRAADDFAMIRARIEELRASGDGTRTGEWVEHGTGLTRFLSTKS
jgi:hypothetical protein